MGVLLILTATVLSLPHRAGAAPDVSWFWEWSDGSRDRHRTLAEATYRTWSRLPVLVVASAPALRGARATLEVHDGRSWRIEDTATTDDQGRSRLTVNPYCRDGGWCDGTTRYRLTVDGSTAPLRVAFRPREHHP